MITFNEACNALERAGLQKGDVIFSHANFALFGRVETVSSADELFLFWMKVIRTVIGCNGTMVFPSFTYSFNSFGNTGVFDILKSFSNVSGMANYIMQSEKQYSRSLDPMLSVVAVGEHAHFITNNIGIETFGEQSVWSRLYELDAKIVNFNIDGASTFLHWVERQAGINYRVNIPMTGTIIDNFGEKKQTTIEYFGRKDSDDHSTAENFQDYHRKAVQFEIVKRIKLGRGIINSSKSKDVTAFTLNQIELTPNFLIMKNYDPSR